MPRPLRLILAFLGLSLTTAQAQDAAGPIPWEQRQAQHQPPPPPPPPLLFQQVCSLCHGKDARGTDRAPALAHAPDLRTSSAEAIAEIIQKGRGKMPAFPLPAENIQTLAIYVRALNAMAMTPMPGDPKAGEAFFFGGGRCATCHLAESRGSSAGPDLSDVADRLDPADLIQSLADPGARVTLGYGRVAVELNDGSMLRGFARAQGSHDLVLQTDDGRLRPLLDREYRSVVPDPQAAMPAFAGTDAERRDLLAFLSRLTGAGVGPLAAPQAPVTPAEIDAIAHPKRGDWPTYNGTVDGNRHSALDQVNLASVPQLQLQWLYPIPFGSLETTPVVIDGIMYVTGNNQVYALSGKSGREIWRYQRPKSPAAKISGDASDRRQPRGRGAGGSHLL